jgi:hypothetical protein
MSVFLEVLEARKLMSISPVIQADIDAINAGIAAIKVDAA